MQLPFYIGIAAPGMIGLLAGGDIALGYEIDDLLPVRLIDIPHKYAEGPVLRAVPNKSFYDEKRSIPVMSFGENPPRQA